MSFDSTLASLGINRTGTSGTTVSATDTSQNLSQSDFLTLLTEQLKNQDPFNPVDNNQMVSQMAQLSEVSGITDMSTTLKAIQSQLSGSSINDAVDYLGKTVLTEGDTAYPRTSGGIAGAVELDGDATNVTITIKDASGATLHSEELGAQSKGTINYDWDGTTDSGAAAGDGPFTVKVTALGDSGSVAARSLVWAPVQSVSMANGAPVLSVAGVGQISVSDIRQIG